MPNIFRGSFCCGFTVKCWVFFSKSFEKSVFKKILGVLRVIFGNSWIGRAVKRNFDKEPLFFNSFLYRGIRAIGRPFGKIADGVNSVIVRIYQGCVLKKAVDFVKNESMTDKFTSFGLFFMTMALSFLLFSILMGINYEIRIYVSWGLFFVGIAVFSAGRHIDTVRQSLVYRAFKYMVELVRM